MGYLVEMYSDTFQTFSFRQLHQLIALARTDKYN